MTDPGLRLFAVSRQATLYGVFSLALLLLLGRGLYTVALGVIFLGLLGQAVSRQGLAIGRALKGLLIMGAVLFFQGLVMAPEAYGISPYPILWCLVTALGVSVLPQSKSGLDGFVEIISLILVVYVFANLTYNLLWTHWPRYGKFGLFSNIHYMSLYAVMTLPIMVYSMMSAPSFRVRCVIGLALLGNVWLLLETRSRPGYLAVLCSALVVIPWLAPHFRWRLFIFMAMIVGFLYLGNVANFSTRIDDFVAHFAQDERWEIWIEAIRLQERSTGLQWIFGHGIGAFFHDFQGVALSRGIKTYLSQHNFFMEILYSHGIFGLSLVSIAYGLFFYWLASLLRNDQSKVSRRTGILLMSVATAQLVHGFSTVPFFSRDYLLPLGFVLGAGFLYGEKSNRTV